MPKMTLPMREVVARCVISMGEQKILPTSETLKKVGKRFNFKWLENHDLEIWIEDKPREGEDLETYKAGDWMKD